MVASSEAATGGGGIRVASPVSCTIRGVHRGGSRSSSIPETSCETSTSIFTSSSTTLGSVAGEATGCLRISGDRLLDDTFFSKSDATAIGVSGCGCAISSGIVGVGGGRDGTIIGRGGASAGATMVGVREIEAVGATKEDGVVDRRPFHFFRLLGGSWVGAAEGGREAGVGDANGGDIEVESGRTGVIGSTRRTPFVAEEGMAAAGTG